MRDTIPIGTIDFNVKNIEENDVPEILNKIREIDGLYVYEQGHNETYTIAKEEN